MNKKEIEEKKKKAILFIIGAALSLLIAILVLVFVSQTIEEHKEFENANFIEVEAIIVDYTEQKDYIQSYYITFYKYESPDGYIYSGFWRGRIKTEEEAKAQIGMKVPIYVDHDLHLHKKSKEVNNTGVIFGVSFGSICLLISLVLIILSTLKFVQWNKGRVDIEEVCDKDKKEDKAPKNFSTLHIAILIVTVVMGTGVLGSSISKENKYQAYENAQFVEVQGEISHYNEFEKDGSAYYVTYYKYIDAKGREYSDMWQNELYDKAEAEAAIGSAVTLYYDSNLGVLKSMDDLIKVPKPDHTLNIIVFVIFLTLLLNSLVRFIRFIIRNERYEAKQKRQGKIIG